MDKVKEFFQGSSKPAEEAQTGDKPTIQHQRVDSSVTPADVTSPDETSQVPESKTADEPSGEAGQDLKDTGLTETQPELLEASKEPTSLEEAQNKASENAPSLDNQGEGEQKDTTALSQEPAAQDTQAEPEASPAPAVEPDSEHGDPTKLREDDPAAQDTTAVADEPQTSTIEPSKLSQDDPAAQDAQAEPHVSTTEPVGEPTQLGGGDDTVQGGDTLVGSKPDEPVAQEQSEDKPQESLSEEKPQAEAVDEQPTTSVTEGGATDDAAGAGLDEAKDAGIHETQPELLEPSQEGTSSIDDAQTKAEENAPDVAQPADQAPAIGEAEGGDAKPADAKPITEQPSEAKDDSGPSVPATEGGALASSDGLGDATSQDKDQLPVESQQESGLTAQDASGDVSASAIKPEEDVPRQDEQQPSIGGTETQDTGLSQPEPSVPEVSESSQPAGDAAPETAQETVPDVPAEEQQPLTSEPQEPPTADEPKEDQGLSQPEVSGAGVGDSQVDPLSGDSKPTDVPETQQESLVDAGGPPKDIQPEESAPIDQPKETPAVEGASADQTEGVGEEEGEDTGDPDKKPKLTERLKQKVKNIVNKDE